MDRMPARLARLRSLLRRGDVYEEVQDHVRSLQELLAEIPRPPPGIGHNRPPEPLDAEPFNETDHTELAQALEVLKAQPLEPADKGKAAQEATSVVQTKMEKLRGWLARKGELFTDEAIKEAGKQFGKWGSLALWALLIDHMFHVIEKVPLWLNMIFGSP
jgi:hypothetical protein